MELVCKVICDYLWKSRKNKRVENNLSPDKVGNKTKSKLKSKRERISMITQVFRVMDIIIASKAEIQLLIDEDEDGYDT